MRSVGAGVFQLSISTHYVLFQALGVAIEVACASRILSLLRITCKTILNGCSGCSLFLSQVLISLAFRHFYLKSWDKEFNRWLK